MRDRVKQEQRSAASLTRLLAQTGRVGAAAISAQVEVQNQGFPDSPRAAGDHSAPMTTLVTLPEVGHIALRRGRVSLPGQLYLVTTCTADRRPCFANETAARAACDVLADPSTWPGAHPLVWVLMPDHWHGLLRLSGIEALSTVMARAKAAVRRHAPAAADKPLWQRSFHDHAVRSDESVIDVGRYVLANPVRARLVPHWSDWRWLGGEWLAAFEAELPWCG